MTPPCRLHCGPAEDGVSGSALDWTGWQAWPARVPTGRNPGQRLSGPNRVSGERLGTSALSAHPAAPSEWVAGEVGRLVTPAQPHSPPQGLRECEQGLSRHRSVSLPRLVLSDEFLSKGTLVAPGAWALWALGFLLSTPATGQVLRGHPASGA